MLNEDVVAVERKGRFGHRVHPAEDFVEEVEQIRALKARAGSGERAALLERIDSAMNFRVGGDSRAVDAKHDLRQMEFELKVSIRTSAGLSEIRDLAIFLLARDENGPDFTDDHKAWATRVIDHDEGHHCSVPGTPSTCVPCVRDEYLKNARGIHDFLSDRRA